MTLNEFLSFNDLSPELCALIENFEVLCEEIGTLTDQENTNFMAGIDVRAIVISSRKEALLKSFEKRAHNIFELIKAEAPHNVTLHNYFLSRIGGLQDKLKVNTSLQMHAINQVHQDLRDEKVGGLCH